MRVLGREAVWQEAELPGRGSPGPSLHGEESRHPGHRSGAITSLRFTAGTCPDFRSSVTRLYWRQEFGLR